MKCLPFFKVEAIHDTTKSIFIISMMLVATTISAKADWYTLKYPQYACTSAANYDIAATLSQQSGTTRAQIEEASGCKLLEVGTQILPVRPIGASLALTLVKVGDRTIKVITTDVSFLTE